jgi:hypothetical protein
MASRVKVPNRVLERAKAAVTVAGKKPTPPQAPVTKRLLPREKVERALKKLHPMD